MVTIAHLVKKKLQENPFLLEALQRNIINYAALAEEMLPFVRKEMGILVKESAIMMALRRYAEELEKGGKKMDFLFEGELNLKTGIIDVNVVKTNPLLSKLKEMYDIADFRKGDSLHIILGTNEVAIITNERYDEKLSSLLKHEKILTKQKGLVSLSINFADKSFISTPGVIFAATRVIAWEHINIYEIISTASELTFILKEKDAMRAFNALQEMIKKG